MPSNYHKQQKSKTKNKMIKLKLKCALAFSLLLISTGLRAQTLEDGIKMYKYERFESSKKILEPLASSNPLANYYLGLSELGLQNISGAKAIFQKYPEDNANNAGIARVLFAENKSAEAMAMLTKTAAKAKKKDWAPYKLAADAITYSEGGDPNTAIEWYKKANDVERNGETLISMGDAYRKMQGGGGNAMSNYEDAESFPATQSIANYKMGNLWYAAKNYDSALAKFGRASELDAANPLPFKSLADAYYRVKKYKTSKEKIEKYLELSDQTTDDQIQYANTLFLAKDYPNAINKVNDLVGKGEGEKRPYMYRVLGYSQYETKDYTNAKMNMEKLFAKQDPKKIIYSDYIYMGKILLTDTSKTAMANDAFNKGIAMDTTSDKAPLLREIAEAAFNTENYIVSGKWYKTLVESGSPTIEDRDYWWAGYMAYYSSDYTTAEQMFRTYNQKDTTQALGVLWMARITEKTKDKEYKSGLASSYYNQWLSMVKEDDPAKKKDLIKAYTYLAMVAYTANKKEDTRLFANKLLAQDANNDTAKQLVKALESMK